MAVHIGKEIKELVRVRNIKIDDFASKINCTTRNVYKIFDKPSIDTQLLASIGKVLNENLFFKFLTDKEIAEYQTSKLASAKILEALKELQATHMALQQEYEMKERTKEKKKALKKSTRK